MDLAKTKLEEYEDTIQNLNKMLFSGKQLESNGKRALGAIINDSDRSKDYALRNWNNQVLEEQRNQYEIERNNRRDTLNISIDDNDNIINNDVGVKSIE
jgi:hypothetical protein